MIHQKQIEQAWELRLAQNIEGCRAIVAELKLAMKFPVGPQTDKDAAMILSHSAAPAGRAAILQVLLLAASLQRAEGQKKESLDAIEACLNAARELNLAIPFELPFQKGTSHFALGEYSTALDCYVSSRSLARTPVEHILALGNAIFCLDYLGLPFEKTLRDVENLIEEVGEESLSSILVRQVLNRLETLSLFEDFRSGAIDKIFSSSGRVRRAASEYAQFDYLKLWIQGLPYHSYHLDNLVDRLEELSLVNPFFYNKTYRLGTLQGLLHPNDKRTYQESDFCDRLYLWTWWWLKNPAAFPLQRIMVSIREADLKSIAHKISMDDYQKLKNSLLWLGLFDPRNHARLELIVNDARPNQGREHALYAFEYELLAYLIAKRDQRTIEARDYYQQLKRNPLWGSPSHGLWLVARELEEPSGQALGFLDNVLVTLRDLISNDASSGTAADLVVDMTRFRVEHPASSKCQISEPLSKALFVLHRHGQLSCDEFLSFCFGINGYDSLIHNPKIFNLLSRIRQIAPDSLKFGMKGNQIFAVGSWHGVTFHGPPAGLMAVHSHSEWQTFLLTTPKRGSTQTGTPKWIEPHLLLKKLSGKTEFDREEIERAAGASRSTANRLINSWLERGLVEKRGKARKTVYVLTDTLGKGN